MSLHANPDQFDQPSLPFDGAFGNSNSNQTYRRMTPSVVDGAGLGSFVYLKGFSGRRYVFSVIELDHAALYTTALFARVDSQGRVSRLDALAPTNDSGSTLYVHVLDGNLSSRIDTLADLAVSALNA